jgi:hypothetical protein
VTVRQTAVVAGGLLVLGTVGYVTSGQGSVSGSLVDASGRPLAGCTVELGLRLGVGPGGFDSLAYATGPAGEFTIPVNAGVNRLHFTCPGLGTAAATSVVWRGSRTTTGRVVAAESGRP